MFLFHLVFPKLFKYAKNVGLFEWRCKAEETSEITWRC